jgi:hypothetical protein
MVKNEHDSLIPVIGLIIALLAITAAFPPKAHAIVCTWEDRNGVFHLTDDRSKAPKQSKCDDIVQHEIIPAQHTDNQTLYKKDANAGNHGHSQFEIRRSETSPPPLGSKPKDAELANAIFWILSNRLDLPLPSATVAHVYTGKMAFIDGLMQVGGETNEMATKKVDNFAAFASRRGLLLRSDLLSRMSLTSRAGLFAHELTHISQFKLGEGGRRWPAQWIREGHASWVSYKVLEIMGLRPFSVSRAMVVRSIKTSSTPINSFPDLDTLDNMGKWVEAKSRLGRPATYGQSFLAVDWMIERYGHAKLLELMEKYASDSESGKAWRIVYPFSHRQFIDEFRDRLKSI